MTIQKKAAQAPPSVLMDNALIFSIFKAFHSSKGKDIDLVIQELLEIVIADTDVDRAYVFEKLGPHDTHLSRTYLVCSETPAEDLDPYTTIPIAKIDWYDDIQQGVPRFVSDASVQSSKNESDIRPDDVRSYVQFPIIMEKELIGFVGIANCRSTHHWTTAERQTYQDLSVFLRELIVQKRLKQQIAYSSTIMSTVLDSLDAPIYVVNYDSYALLFANGHMREFCEGQYMPEGKCFDVLYPGAALPCSFCPRQHLTEDQKVISHDHYIESKQAWFQLTSILIDWVDGQKAVLMIYRDISARKKMQQELSKANHMHHFAMTNAKCFSWEVNVASQTIVPDPAVEETTGHSAHELTGDLRRYLEILRCGNIDSLFVILDKYAKSKKGDLSIEHAMLTPNGEVRWLLYKGKFADDDGAIVYGIAIDITARKKYGQQLSERIYKDSLTGLYNMQYLLDHRKGLAIDGNPLAVLVLDIRSFKNLNEAFGYEYGDKVLVSVVESLLEQLPGFPIFRVSGNRFLIVCQNILPAQTRELARHILNLFHLPISVDHQPVHVNFKIGVAFSGDGSRGIADLLKDAEIALYSAKRNDFQDFQVFDAALRSAFDSRMNMELELQHALQNKDLVMYYQPKVDIKTNAIIGAEALIRWKHKERDTLILPADFITLAEETGQIIEIGNYVIETVTKQLRTWLDKGLDFFVSLNVSAKQFVSPGLSDTIKKWLAFYSVPPKSLGLEITETIMISDFLYVKNVLTDLQEYGIKILLDDFGCGYSSMNYLSKIPIDTIKVDKTFLDSASTNKKELSILKSIITLSHALHLSVTVEGIETEAQLEILKQFDCDTGQGYLLSEPLPPDAFEDLFNQGDTHKT